MGGQGVLGRGRGIYRGAGGDKERKEGDREGCWERKKGHERGECRKGVAGETDEGGGAGRAMDEKCREKKGRV